MKGTFNKPSDSKSLRGAVFQYSPGSGGDCCEERNQLGLEMGQEGEEKGPVKPSTLRLELCTERSGTRAWYRGRAGQGKLEKENPR